MMRLPKLPSLKALWAKEPVLVATAVPVLINLGVLTTDQASAVTNAVAGVASIGAQLVVAFKVRSKVTPSEKIAAGLGLIRSAGQSGAVALDVLKTAAEGAAVTPPGLQS